MSSAPRMVLEAAAPDTELMLDLEGVDPRLPGRVAAALRNRPHAVTG